MGGGAYTRVDQWQRGDLIDGSGARGRTSVLYVEEFSLYGHSCSPVTKRRAFCLVAADFFSFLHVALSCLLNVI
jgi:hypothetical protein